MSFDISSLLETWAKKPKVEKIWKAGFEAEKEPETVDEGKNKSKEPKAKKKPKDRPGKDKDPATIQDTTTTIQEVSVADKEEESSYPEPEGKKARFKVLKCGHMNHSLEWEVEEDPKQEEASSQGFCCRSEMDYDIRFKSNNPGVVRRTGPQIHWEVRGTHEPVPVPIRKTKEKLGGIGWPGLCCDQDGFYIGGVGNDCRFYRPEGKDKCQAHSGTWTKASVPETEPGDE